MKVLTESESLRMHAQALRRTRRNDHLQACVARGNTQLVPTYAATRDDGQRYLGHRAKFKPQMQSAFMDNVTRLSVGRNVPDAVIDVLVDAARGRKLGGSV